MYCYHCKASLKSILPERGQISRSAICHNCSREIRVCMNCAHYDSSYHNQCKESSAERVVDKEKANFCEYFQINTLSSKANMDEKNEDVKKGFDQLFK